MTRLTLRTFLRTSLVAGSTVASGEMIAFGIIGIGPHGR